MRHRLSAAHLASSSHDLEAHASLSVKAAFHSAGDPMATIIPAKWETDVSPVVLEIQSETSKATHDSEPASLREVLQQLEEEGIVDTSLHCHECERPEATADHGFLAASDKEEEIKFPIES